MIVLRVDGVELPLHNSNVEMPSYDASKLHSVAAWRDGKEVIVEVASTPESDRVLGYAFDLHRGESFNNSLHAARLEVDGMVLFDGKATLLSTEQKMGLCYYRLSLRKGGSDWAESVAKTPLRDSDIEVSMSLLPYDIERSWSGDQAVRFLPLQRDSYPLPKDSGLWGEQRVLLPTDYHPFISVRHLLLSTARAAGYRLESRWAESDMVQKLMISGAYPVVDSASAERAMGFKAYRTTTTSGVANSSGFVFAWTPTSGANAGVIVDSVDPQAVDDDGNRLSDAYSNGALQIVNDRPVFTPTRDISVAFEYKIRYRTEYRITSSLYLTGFDRIKLAPGCEVELRLENPYDNQASSLVPNLSYKLFIFDYDETAEYRLNDIGVVSGPVSDVVTPANCPSSTRLFWRKKGTGYYTAYMGDWALYNGYVEERGERDVELVVRTPYMSLAKGAQERFADISFSGAEPGQKLTLYSGCSLRPLFGGAAGYGDTVTFKDVANHAVTQQSVIEALAHMFNLCVYSDETSRTLVIEPYDDFFSGDVVDLRPRQLEAEWSIVEGGPETFESIKLAYAGSDGVVSRENAVSDKEFGLWSHTFEGYATKQGQDSRVNPLFYPTLSLSGYVGTAPLAEVLAVGDREKLLESDYVEPRIVLYHGMQPLPTGQKWTAYSSASKYPYAAFHSTLCGQTLCFEDRDGCEGLHRYHIGELDEQALRGSLRCKISLPLTDYLSLFDPNNSTLSIRSRFRLEVEGASSLFTLRGIEHYDPEQGVATCLFRRTLID